MTEQRTRRLIDDCIAMYSGTTAMLPTLAHLRAIIDALSGLDGLEIVTEWQLKIAQKQAAAKKAAAGFP